MKEVQADLKREQTERVQAVQAMQHELIAQTKKTMELLKSVHTGGLSMSIAGLLWLAVGVVVATFPDRFF
ncbi:hypothetical protein [Povalibacter sp.]|uniref:hypothetical protein n=1 Tax=Povalibacter sp. TaxID=1962978 RepID=UPI002F4100C3